MATSLKSQLLQQVECSICYDTLNTPKVLSCLHTFCLKCLTQVVNCSNQKNELKCPTCRNVTSLSSKGVQELSNNFILQGVLDTLTQAKTPTKEPAFCDHCDEKQIATHYCEECQEHLCEIHTKGHKMGKQTKMHQLNQLIQDAKYEVRECEKHKGEKLLIICSTCDDMLICRDCAMVTHKAHEYMFISEIIDEKRQKLKVIVDKTASFTTKLEEDIARVDQRIKDIQKKHEEEVNKNKQSCDVLITAIKEKMNGLEKELDALCADRIRSLQTEKQKLLVLLDTGRCSKSSMIDSYSDVRLIEMEREISQQHCEMQKEMSKDINICDSFFVSKVNVQVMLQHLKSWSVARLDNFNQVMLAEMKESGYSLQYAPNELKNDKEFVLAAVKQYGFALDYASNELKNDKEVVLAAVKQHGYALRYASNELKNDKEFVLAAVKQYGYALEYASNELKNDKEVVLAAVKQNGFALKYASHELKNDREVVLAAVKQDGRALQYASNELKNDKEFVLALKQ